MADRKHKLTTTLCNKLLGPEPYCKSKEIEYTHAATLGLKFYVTATGIRGWRYRYTYQNKKRSISIGNFPGIGVDEARSKAIEFSAQLDRGIDPQAPINVQREILTFEAFAKDMYLPYIQDRKRSASDDESKLRVHLYAVFGRYKLNVITRHQIEVYLAKIAKSHCPSTSNRHFALLSYMFTLAINWEVVTSSPCAGIKKLREPTDKGRSFTPEEIAALFQAWHKSKSQQAINILDLLFYLGLRLGEVMNARWENVDLENGRLYLSNTKAGKPRDVTLNDEALNVFRSIKRIGDSPWVFPGKDPSKSVDNITKAWEGALKRAGIGHARRHDLRHHFGTTAANNANIPPTVLQGLMGHASFSTTLKYIHRDDKTQRSAAQKTVEHLFGPPA